MSTPCLFRHHLSAACLAGFLLAVAATSRAADAGPQEDPPPRWWFGLQLGFVSALDRPDPMTDSGGMQLLSGLEGGVRVGQDWRLGLLLDGGSLGKVSCPAEELLCNSRKQDIAHHYLTLVFNPGRGRWLYQLAAGRVVYDLMENYFDDGYYVLEDASGWGVRLGVGYDWHRPGARTRLGWRASLGRANPGRLGGGLGSTAHTTISLAASLSWY